MLSSSTEELEVGSRTIRLNEKLETLKDDRAEL